MFGNFKTIILQKWPLRHIWAYFLANFKYLTFLSLEDWERSKNLHMGSKLLHLTDFLWNSPFGADLSKLYQKLPTCLRHFSNSYLKINFPKLQQGSKIYSGRSHWDAKYVKNRMIFLKSLRDCFGDGLGYG